MSPTHAVKKGKRYRYYVSAPLITGSRTEHLDGRRIPAGDVEGLVLDRLRALFASEKEVGEAIAPALRPRCNEQCSTDPRSWLSDGRHLRHLSFVHS